jgi:serpin B
MESKLSTVGLLLIVSALIFSGCGPTTAQPTAPPPTPTPPGKMVQSEKQRETSPDVAEADLAELVSGNSAFAFDLYQAIRDESDNLFYSPYSISLALAMTYAGARGETERQMADTLHFILSQNRLHPAFNALDLELARRAQMADEEDEHVVRLPRVGFMESEDAARFQPDRGHRAGLPRRLHFPSPGWERVSTHQL